MNEKYIQDKGIRDAFFIWLKNERCISSDIFTKPAYIEKKKKGRKHQLDSIYVLVITSVVSQGDY